MPVALTPGVRSSKTVTWAAFIRRNALASIEMAAILDAIRAFAWPVMEAVAKASPLDKLWSPAKGWHPPKE